MQRRDFLRLSGIAASTLVLPVFAKPELPLVVWFGFADEKTLESYFSAFQKGLRERGLIAGQTIRFESYFARFSTERMRELIPEILAMKPAVVVVQGPAIRHMTQATKTIPLVVATSGDLVDGKVIASLARPGGNVTGQQFQTIEIVGKRMELLKKIYPKLQRVAVIADPGHAGETNERSRTLEAADRLGIRVDYKPVTNPAELQAALDSLPGSGVEAIVAFPDSITFRPRKHIADFAIQHKLLTVSGWDAYADAGFLLIYGPSTTAIWERTAYFVDRILKGTKPADLPAEIPNVIEMVVNLKTARALGIKVPENILLRANRVIE